MYETIDLACDARGVARLALARPDKHNAMSEQMLDELTDAARALAEDAAVRVVVLEAQGKSFCAGGDLNWMRAQMELRADVRTQQAGKLAYMLRALAQLPQPLIGKLQGNAFGGGVGLACVCDVAIGADTILMGLTETRLGLIPATIGPYVIARMGQARARRVFMSSRRFDAAEAVSLDLLTRAVAPDALEAAVEAEVIPYLSCAPGAVAEAKALIATLGGAPDLEDITLSIEALTRRWDSAEAREGLAAFFAKHPPPWST